MAPDTFTESSTEGWFSRIGNAFKGILFGIVLFGLSFVVLFWNEGRAVRTARNIAEGAKSAVSVGADKVDPANEGKLIHLTGEATTSDVLTDGLFQVSATAIQLQRHVEIYQWQEKKESKKEKNLGGSETTTTVYTYTKGWDSQLHASSQFKHPEGHENPAAPAYPAQTFWAKQVQLGAFRLSDDLIQQITDATPVALTEAHFAKLAADLKAKLKLASGQFYQGANPGDPQVGDARISFTQVPPMVISLLSGQNGQSFAPFVTKSGGRWNVVATGAHTADDMFQQAKEANAMMTWILRLVGFLMMAIGISMTMGPLVVLADVIPFIGDLVGGGVFILALLVSVPMTLITIAVGWIFYRPLIGIPLLLLAMAGVVYGIKWFLARRQQRQTSTASALAG